LRYRDELIAAILVAGCGAQSPAPSPITTPSFEVAHGAQIASPILRLTQHSGGVKIVSFDSAEGSLTTQYSDGSPDTPVHGAAIRYRDGALFDLSYAGRTYTQSSLAAEVASRVATRSSLSSGTQTAGATVSIQGGIRRTTLREWIHGFLTHAYDTTVNGMVSRTWYLEGGPLPPHNTRNTLAALAVTGSTACDCDDVTRFEEVCGKQVAAMELAGRTALRSQVLVGREWTTTLDTTEAEWVQEPIVFGPPAGWTASPPPSVTPLVASPRSAAPVLKARVADGSNLSATVLYFGGATMPNPELHVYFWGSSFSDPVNAGGVSALTSALGTIVGGAGVAGLGEYGINPGTVASVRTISAAPPASIVRFPGDATETAALVLTKMFSDGPLFWWNTGPDPLFVIVINNDEVGSSDWDPFHLDTISPTFLLPFPLLLLVHEFMPWALVGTSSAALAMPATGLSQRDLCDGTYIAPPVACSAVAEFDNTTVSLSHEIFEAATDPYPFSGFMDPSKLPWWDDAEISDICEPPTNDPQNRFTRAGDVVISTVWSNEARDCVGPYFPSIAITSPSPNAVVGWFGPTTVIGCSASASDPIDRDPRRSSEISWSLDGVPSFLSGDFVEIPITTAGQHTVTATFANAENELSVSDSVTFTASNNGPVVVIDSPTDQTTVPMETSVTLAGHGTSQDYPGGLPATALSWFVDGVFIGSGSTLTTTLGHAGDVVINLLSEDSLGLVGSASVTVHVISPATGPVVSITSPQDGDRVMWNLTSACDIDALICPVSVGFTATATAADGSAIDPSQIQWSDDDEGALGAGSSIDNVFQVPDCVNTFTHVTATVVAPDGTSASDTILVAFISHGC
jgi:hypothetical protein